jgi:hypothetical protein
MWGRGNTLPRIESYDEAKHVYENTKPIRGNPAFRPLDRRSIYAKGSIKQVGDNYVLQLYSTDIVTYYPNGDVLLNTGNYSTVSTADAVGQVSPFSCWISKGRVCVCNRYNKQGSFLVQPTLLFKRDAEGIYRPENPPIAVVRKKRVLKDKAKLARDIFKQVPVYIKAFSVAFDRGVKPKHDHTSITVAYRHGETLEDQQAVNLAWAYVSEDYHVNGLLILNEPVPAIARFWKDVYNKRGVIEQYTVDLPLGEV